MPRLNPEQRRQIEITLHFASLDELVVVSFQSFLTLFGM